VRRGEGGEEGRGGARYPVAELAWSERVEQWLSGSRAASEDEAEMLIMEKWMRVQFENKCYSP
jgi:hypothetical protein